MNCTWCIRSCWCKIIVMNVLWVCGGLVSIWKMIWLRFSVVTFGCTVSITIRCFVVFIMNPFQVIARDFVLPELMIMLAIAWGCISINCSTKDVWRSLKRCCWRTWYSRAWITIWSILLHNALVPSSIALSATHC